MAIEVTSEHAPRRPRIKQRLGYAVRLRASNDKEHRRRTTLYCIVAALCITLASVAGFLVYSYLSYSKLVDERLASGYLTSRAGIYAAPRTLRVGQSISSDGLVALLRRAGYIESDASNVWSGSFTSETKAVLIRPRHLGGSSSSSSANSSSTPDVVRVRFDKNNRIDELTGDLGVSLSSFTLEPEALTNNAAMKAGQRPALSYQDIPPLLVQAILSIEDHRFFEHGGVDLIGIGRALLRNAGENEIGQGGSTITQQLVKNTYLSPERTLRRKFAEAMLAFTLERRLSKEDIFALYCNEVYLGQRGGVGVRGVEQAARLYFGKELKDLSLAEAATIAGMIQGPSRYTPERHTEAAIARRNTVLGTMVRDGSITMEQAAASSREPLIVIPIAQDNNSLAPYFVDYVNRVVESKLEAGGPKDESGLRVYTTLDLDLQGLAEAALTRQLARLDKMYQGRGVTPQAALVALDPKTGDVLAMVGGRDYASSQLNRATDAARQPGSVFKPIVYAAALESGLSPMEMYTDAPREFVYDRRSVYRPANYGGGYAMRDVTMRTGLVKSLNVVTVDVAMRTGLARVAELAQGFGLNKPEPYPALALGTTEATPLQMAAAYTAFAGEGKRAEPNPIARATDSSGTELVSNITAPPRQIISPATAFMMTDMLEGVIDHGTAHAARGAVKKSVIAGKNGTSRDGWFVGYTPNLVCAVWIGFDDNRQLGLTGAEAALPAWVDFIESAVEVRPELGGEAFQRPVGIVNIEIDPETGMLATPSCPQRERISITNALAPHFECYTHNQPDALIASATDEGFDNTNSAVLIQPDGTRTPAREVASNDRPLPPARHAPYIEAINNHSLMTTHIETDRRGRSTLVNDMRMDNRNHAWREAGLSP
jgi:penicillin-binding protein 1B